MVRSMLQALQADGPHPDHAEELSLFGQFVGAWAVDNAYFDDEGEERYDAEWRFGWTLDGRAVQDVLFHPPVSKANGTRAHSESIGTTVRLFEPRTARHEGTSSACAGGPTGTTSRSPARTAGATACAGASSRSRTTPSTGTASSVRATAASGGWSRRCSRGESPEPTRGPAPCRASGRRRSGRVAGPRRTSAGRRVP